MIPMTTDEERRIHRLLRALERVTPGPMSNQEKTELVYDFLQESMPKPLALAPPTVELLDILHHAEWACWEDHAECPSCGAEPDLSYHKYGVVNGGHYKGCRLAKALGARACPTRPDVPPAPEWIKDGARVWYQSSPGPAYRFAGTVDGTPRLLGGHTWVVHLRDMDPKYRGGARTTVPAAACDALIPYDCRALSPYDGDT